LHFYAVANALEVFSKIGQQPLPLGKDINEEPLG
jgi:hypothetical protein